MPRPSLRWLPASPQPRGSSCPRNPSRPMTPRRQRPGPGRHPPATNLDHLKAPKGFRVELLYSVAQGVAGLLGEHDG